MIDQYNEDVKNAEDDDKDSFDISDYIKDVQHRKIFEDSKGMLTVYDPDDPTADEDGYVTKSNVNIVEEMVNMISASRSYEANATALDANKSMAQKALEIGS